MRCFACWVDLVLRLYPLDFRRRHGREMRQMLLLDHRLQTDRHRLRAVGPAVGALLQLLATGLSLRIARRRADEQTSPATDFIRQHPSRRSPRDLMNGFLRDLAFATRSLLRTPAFSAIAVVNLALGVGAVTAIFAVFHGVLLAPLPYDAPDQLVHLFHRSTEDPSDDRGSVSFGNFADWREQSRHLQSLSAGFTQSATLTGGEQAERIMIAASLGSPFDVLRTQPLAGRLYNADADRPEAPAIAVISARLAESRFGSAQAAVDQALVINGRSRTVVGVVPPGFSYPQTGVDAWLPSRFGEQMRADRTEFWLRVVGRLAHGSSLDEARAEMSLIAARLREEHPQANGNVDAAVAPMAEVVVGDAARRLGLLQGAVALVLLIACANLVHLLLARREGRRGEISVRRALGAGRGRLLREELAVSTVLGMGAAALGIPLGGIGLGLLRERLPAELPRLDEIALTGEVVLLLLAVVFAVALVCGTLPVLAQRRSTSDGLGSRRGATQRVGGGLVVAEVALAVILLVGAGLLLRSFLELQKVDPGFAPERLLAFELSVEAPADHDDHRVANFYDQLEERLRALPGVESVGLVSTLPGAGRASGAWIHHVGRPLPEDETPPIAVYRVASPDYFGAVGLPLRSGRGLGEGDGRDGTPAVLINETAARTFWPEGDALGSEITLGPNGGWIPASRVVGVVADAPHRGLGTEPLPVVYMPRALLPMWGQLAVVVRTQGDPWRLAGPARELVRELDPDVPLANLTTLHDVLDASLAPARSMSLLQIVFAGVALVLAAVGVFGTLSYSVRQRRRELGVRLALGADAGDLRQMVLGQALRRVTVGVVLGLASAVALSRWIDSVLYGVRSTDPTTYAAVVVVLLLAALVATWVPAHRAARSDPRAVLDAE